jgi:hypothetical protein
MRKSVIALAIMIPVVVLGILYIPSLLTRVSMRQYSFGQEIKGFPIDKTAVTFTAWTTIKRFDATANTAREGNTFVVINYTVRNIGDMELDIIDFAFSGAPILKFGNYYADPIITVTSTYWGFYFDAQYSSHYLMPNQSQTNGFIYHEILEGQLPVELVYPNKESPQITIKIG